MAEVPRPEEEDDKSEASLQIRPDLRGLIARLDMYNSYFSSQAVTGRIVDSLGEGRKQKRAKEEDKQLESFTKLELDYEGALNRTGLALDAVSDSVEIPSTLFIVNDDHTKNIMEQFAFEHGFEKKDVDNSGSYENTMAQQFLEELREEAKKPVNLSKIGLKLEDADKFFLYMEFLQAQGVKKDDKVSLERVAGMFKSQLIKNYDPKNPDSEKFSTLAGSFEKIAGLYESLGMGNSVEELKRLLEVSNKKYLPEFLQTEEKKYLESFDQGFGPAKWHTDMTPGKYEKRWMDALKVFRQTAKNPNAKELSDKLRDHLLQAVEIAQKDIQAKPRKKLSKYERNNYPSFLRALENARDVLNLYKEKE